MTSTKCSVGQSLAIFRFFVLSTFLMLAGCSSQEQQDTIGEELIELNNRGVALMGRFDYQGAVDVFSEIVEQNQSWSVGRINLAIALKNRQGDADAERALTELHMVLAKEPENVQANYNSGVLQLYLGKVDLAKEFFEAALKTDSDDAYLHYYLGQCQLRTGDQEGALASYSTSIKLDPYLRSAYYSSAQVLRRLGRVEEANQQLELFQRFENNPRARLAEFKYTRMGPKSVAQVVGAADVKTKPAVHPEGPLFNSQVVIAELELSASVTTLTTVDIDKDGSQDLFLTSNEAGNALFVSEPDLSVNKGENHPWLNTAGVNAVAWGDTDNNGLVDLYLCRTGANQLWLQIASNEWKLAGPNANIADGENDCADVAMVDADHDGDLDILLGNRAAGDNLLNNNRDGTFRSLRDQLGSASEIRDTLRVLTADIDSDDDVDLIFISEEGPNLVLVNDRLWNYQLSTVHQAFSGTAIQALSAVDIDADGQTELLSLNAGGEIELWRADNQWSQEKIYQTEISSELSPDLASLDISGNGQAELLLLGEGVFEVLQVSPDLNVKQLAFETYEGGKAIPVVRSNRGSSLIAIQESEDKSQEIIEWPPGQGRFEFITLSFSGKHDAAETMRSNHSGIGTKVSVRTSAQWNITNTHKNSSLPGYSLQPISVGLAGQDKADFIAVEWSDGVYQTELDLESGSVTTIAEEQRQLGSCPVLFVWNGTKFDFVTDILGVGAQGFLVEPGILLPPRPWERVAFRPGEIEPKDGSIQFKVTEPMEENSYIDSMALESYDVPKGWELVLDERMGTGAPVVTGDTLFYQKAIEPVMAVNSKGLDVLAEIKQHDQEAMPAGNIDRRFIGLLKEPESLTIEFNQPIDRLAERPDALPVLMAESWVELPYSQTHFSAWQAGSEFRSVSLDARTKNGEWISVHPEFGIPGGMPRTISLPLTEVPQGATAIRLRWNRQIYWDRVRVVFTEQAPAEVHKQTTLPTLARVAKSGFFKRVNHAQRRPEYIYQEPQTFGDVIYPTGFYTSLGEMTELIVKGDDALAIIGPGEEIHVEFEATDAPAQGFDRWYVLETRGWAKDKDMYTHTGNTVEPLPRAYPEASAMVRDALHQKYNTRFQSGR